MLQIARSTTTAATYRWKKQKVELLKMEAESAYGMSFSGPDPCWNNSPNYTVGMNQIPDCAVSVTSIVFPVQAMLRPAKCYT
jgi:hypothetical protein